MKIGILLFILSLLINHSNNAQTVAGFVKDKETKNSIPFAFIVFKNNSTAVKQALSTDSSGTFKVKLTKGSYTATISSLNHKAFTQSIDIQGDTSLSFLLLPGNKVLDEVMIVAEKTTIEQLIDKKIINVGKDLLSAGGDATNVLEQLAEIKIDPDGNLALRGSKNVNVLLNGKKVSLSVAELLKQIPASQISKIEVITTPTAKYQANGLTGIINIITQKKVKAGFASVINSNVNSFHSYGLNTSTSYGTDKLGFKVGLNTNKFYSETKAVLDRQGFSPYVQETDFSFDGKVNEINGAIDWYKSAKEFITLNSSLIDNTHSLFRGSNINSNNVLSKQINYGYHQHKTFDNSLTYRYNFNDKEYIQLDARLSKNDNYISNDFVDNSKIADNTINNTATIYDFATDYVTSLTKKINLETGYAFNRVQSDNNLLIFNNLEQNNNNITTNTENIHALYFLSQVDLGKWKIQGGIRGELFDRNAIVKTSSEKAVLNYKNLFPSIHFTYQPNDMITWSAGFSRRTSRPSLDQVLTVSYQDHPFNTDIGNPNLLPEFSNNFELTWQLNKKKFSFNTTLSHRSIENNIVYFSVAGTNDQIIGSYKNISGGNSFVWDMSVNLKLFNWMTNTISTNYVHQSFNTDNVPFANSFGNSFTLQFANDITITKSLSANVRYSFNARETSIYSEDKSYNQLQIGARQKVKLFNKDASFGLRVSDLVNSLSYKNTTYGLDFNTSFARRPVTRILFLTFSINLNNGRAIKKINKKEREYINGTNG
jgi:outer membrane receptor protein involved in Fe transport